MTKSSLADALPGWADKLNAQSVVAGFDGFVDEMITVVEERQNLDAFRPVNDIATFGRLISAAAGHSSLREIVVNRVDPGGCAVNLGDGLIHFGVALDLFATLGEPHHPAFAPMTAGCRSVHSWGREPGRTLAFEFADGKLMFSAVRQLADFAPATIAEKLAGGEYQKACADASVIALTDWTLYPHMTAVWEMLRDEVYDKLPAGKRFFVDLVDPSSRSADDILAALKVLPSLAGKGVLTLGVNGNEANLLARLVGAPEATDDEESIALQAAALRKVLGIDEVVVHWIKFAAVAGSDGQASVSGPYCAQPRKSTGAGDRFNAGYLLGQLLSLPPRERLLLATASSGFFVRAARSGNLDEMASFLRLWEENRLEDFSA